MILMTAKRTVNLRILPIAGGALLSTMALFSGCRTESNAYQPGSFSDGETATAIARLFPGESADGPGIVTGFDKGGVPELLRDFGQSKEEIGWHALRPLNSNFQAMAEGAVIEALPATSLRGLHALYFGSQPVNSQSRILFIQRPEQHLPLAVPPEGDAERVGAFDVWVVERGGGRVSASFYTGYSVDGQRIVGVIQSEGFGREDVREFVRSLN